MKSFGLTTLKIRCLYIKYKKKIKCVHGMKFSNYATNCYPKYFNTKSIHHMCFPCTESLALYLLRVWLGIVRKSEADKVRLR